MSQPVNRDRILDVWKSGYTAGFDHARSATKPEVANVPLDDPEFVARLTSRLIDEGLIVTADEPDGQAIKFTGSTAHAIALHKWIETGIYRDSPIRTRDLTIMEVTTPTGTTTVRPGEWIIRHNDGTVTVLTRKVVS